MTSSLDTLRRRLEYGGKKGRSARKRLRAIARRPVRVWQPETYYRVGERVVSHRQPPHGVRVVRSELGGNVIASCPCGWEAGFWGRHGVSEEVLAEKARLVRGALAEHACPALRRWLPVRVGAPLEFRASPGTFDLSDDD